jgi:hypothetical protein
MRLWLTLLAWVVLLPAARADDKDAAAKAAEDKAYEMISRLKGRVEEMGKGPYLGVTFDRLPPSDDDLALLKGLPLMRHLSISSGKVTNDGLKHLAALTDLEALGMNCPLVDDSGLKHLEKLTRLWHLSLRCPKLTDKGMESLKGLTDMRDLNLWKCQITDEGLKPLVGMRRLQSLDLSDTQVTRKGLPTIKKFTELQGLSLNNCPLFDDSDLKEFLDLPQLRRLYLWRTGVTGEGMRRLMEAKPGLRASGP